MKKLIKISLFSLSILSVLSCSKKDEIGKLINQPTESIIASLSDGYDGNVWVSASSSDTWRSSASISISFKNNKAERVDAGSVSIGGYVFQANDKSVYQTNFDKQAIAKPNEIIELFGKTVPIKIAGNAQNGFETITEEVLLPQPIKMMSHTATSPPENYLIKSGQGIPLTWESNNASQKIIIRVTFVPNESVLLPAGQKTNSWSSFADDNGTFNIPASVIQSFGNQGTINVSLVRYSAHEVEASRKKIAIVGYFVHSLKSFKFE